MSFHPLSNDKTLRILVENWGGYLKNAAVIPLSQLQPKITSGVSYFTLVRVRGESLVLKQTFDSDAIRSMHFSKLKYKTTEICRANGVPAICPCLTVTGDPIVFYGGHSFELLPYVHPAIHYEGLPKQQESLISCLIDLSRALEKADSLRDELKKCTCPYLVDQKDPVGAVKEIRSVLLPALDEKEVKLSQILGVDFAAVVNEFEEIATDYKKKGRFIGVCHGDLHGQNILFGSDGRLKAVIDFDNLHIGDTRRDIAWVLDQLTWIPGKPDQFDFQTLRNGVRAIIEGGLCSKEEICGVMPSLLYYTIPIVVDIAKDILFRDDDRIVWKQYLELLDSHRKIQAHKEIIRFVEDTI